jgi:hypothetical protein
MKNKILVVLAILLFGVAFAFAGSGMKTLVFGTHTYSISEAAPDFLKWTGRLVAATLISEPPDLCAMDAVEGINADGTVRIVLVRLIESDSVYIVALMVAYTQKSGVVEVYEDLGLIQTGKPSFVLTKVSKPSDIEIFIAAKSKQHGKMSGIQHILLPEL